MIVTDPIADLLTRIRNANQMHYKEVVVPSSNVKYITPVAFKILRFAIAMVPDESVAVYTNSYSESLILFLSRFALTSS